MSHSESRAHEWAAHPRRLTLGALAWMAVVGLTGFVQLLRGQWGDAVIFGVALVLLIADAAGLLRVGDRAARPGLGVVGAGAALAALTLSLVPRHSVWMAVILIAIAFAAILVAWPDGSPASGHRSRPRESWPRALRGLAWSWAVIWIAGCLWELVQVTLGGSVPSGRELHPALSDLLDPLVATWPGQMLFAVCWAAIGVFLVRRGVSRGIRPELDHPDPR